MKKLTQKTVLMVAVFAAWLFFASFLYSVQIFLPFYSLFVSSIGFLLSICIYIGLYSYWIISIYRRIMQSHVRTYLMLIGVNILFWVSLRAVKWFSFIFVIFEDRFLWYMYYIPMILLALFFFFTSLCVGQNEEYRINKKWNLLYIPSILLIISVLTNDLHGLAFNIDISLHAATQDYSHGIVYFLVFIYILSMVLLSSFIILRKFNSSKMARKYATWPLVIVIIALIYCIAYIIKPLYGIGYYLDLTIFGCTVAIAILESFIKTGLIPSNFKHMECFEMSDIKAQIISSDGDIIYKSKDSLQVKKERLEELKHKKTILLDSNTLTHITKIKGGYVAWNSDISQINNMINAFKLLNDKLYKEVSVLSLENEQKGEAARLQKLNDLNSIMLKEILPLSEKIKTKITNSSKTQANELKRLLFETSMTSTYIKRKVNLILTEQTEKCISTQEIKYCFLESFQLLRLYNKTCVINIINDYDMNLDMAMNSFDLYQSVIEKTQSNFDAIYVTYNFDDSKMIFAIQICGDIKISYSDLDIYKVSFQNCIVEVKDESDSYYISLVMSK